MVGRGGSRRPSLQEGSWWVGGIRRSQPRRC
jgi:hypothetical protein